MARTKRGKGEKKRKVPLPPPPTQEEREKLEREREVQCEQSILIPADGPTPPVLGPGTYMTRFFP